jgi:hypothetical protein
MGNTLFYPGMKVFLNPPMGFGAPENDGDAAHLPPSATPTNFGSLANLLGIGGYYDVITIDSTISRGGQYETTLNCIFAQSGGPMDSIEARCERFEGDGKPVRDISATERAVTTVTTALEAVNPFSSGGNE